MEIYHRNLGKNMAVPKFHPKFLLRNSKELLKIRGALISLDYKQFQFETEAIATFDSSLPHTVDYARQLLQRYKVPFSRYELQLNSSFEEALISLYRLYWWDSFFQKRSDGELEADLLRGLQDLLGKVTENDCNLLSFDEVEELLDYHLKKFGYCCLFGRTGSLRELMIWKCESIQSFNVQLAEGEVLLSVRILQNFLSYGWLGFLSLGVWHTGGWAN